MMSCASTLHCPALHGASTAAIAELARLAIVSVAMVDMATIPPGAAACWLVSMRVIGHRALPSRNSAGRPHSQKTSAREAAVLIARAARTGRDDSTSSCFYTQQLRMMPAWSWCCMGEWLEALPSRNGAGRPESQNMGAREAAVLIAHTARTGSPSNTASCMRMQIDQKKRLCSLKHACTALAARTIYQEQRLTR